MKETQAIDHSAPEIAREERSRRKLLAYAAAVILLALALIATWHYSALGEWASLDRVRAFAEGLRGQRFAAWIMIAAYTLGALVFFPQNVLICATILVFGGVTGGSYALAGTLSGATVTYAIGRWLGHTVVHDLAGTRVDRLSHKLAGRGFLVVAVLRVIPVAPATIVNLVCGALRVRFREYALGTVVGTLPGLVLYSFFGEQLLRFMRDPSASAMLALAGIALVGGALLLWIRKKIERHQRAAQRTDLESELAPAHSALGRESSVAKEADRDPR